MKSNESDQLRLIEAVYIDASMKCTADVFDLRDLETIRSRVEHEGLSFLTITLPQFAKDFERSLQMGYVDSTFFRSFRKNGSIPAFLQGMISLLFDKKTGRIFEHDENSPFPPEEYALLVESIRQICLVFKKIEVDCTDKRVQSAFDGFIKTEQSFDAFAPTPEELSIFRKVAQIVWTPIVGSIDLADIEPRHGPGATAEHRSGNRKYVWSEWTDRLESYFPLIGTGYPMGLPPDSEELKIVSILSMESERPVRVISVPKTLKAPRIIAIEPCCMQFVQQGIRNVLYRHIESDPLTSGHVNFRDQSINQGLALSSSIDGQLATIDLSDASDRVPLSLVSDMFMMHPLLWDVILACRSNSAQLPSGHIVAPLRKFASMGSALCFPIEAMYFYTICIVALLKIQNLPETKRNIFEVSRSVYIYGDDIVVPAVYAESVLDYLHKYNCKVNSDKTFYRGSFRESCGVDAFNGIPVTPVYIRKLRPKNRRHSAELVSWTATANAFYLKGYWRTASLMRKAVEKILGHLPYVSEKSSALGHISVLGMRTIRRWSTKLQRFEIRAWVPSPVYRTDKLDGYAALAKSLLVLTDRQDPFTGQEQFFSPVEGLRDRSDLFSTQDRSHLEQSALHGAVTLKRRWVPTLT